MTDPYNEAVTDALPPDDNLRIGTVTQNAPLIVNIQGGLVISPGVVNYADFAAGDTVALLRQDSTWLCLGVVATSDLPVITGEASLGGAPGAGTVASASYTLLGTPLSNTFVKRVDSTHIKTEMSASCFTTAVNTKVSFGVQFVTPDMTTQIALATMVSMLINPANEHTMLSGVIHVTGVPAGQYVFRPVWRRDSGAGTLTVDANDWVSIAVSEVN